MTISMKQFNKIAMGLALGAMLFASCKDDDAPVIPGGIAVDKENIAIGPEGGMEILSISSKGEWVAGASQPWISVSPANGMGNADCVLAIDSTLENGERTAKIRISMDGKEPKLVNITQFGFYKQIVVREPQVEVENSAAYAKRFFESAISTNVAMKVEEKVTYAYDEESIANLTDEEKSIIQSELDAMNASGKGWITLPNADELKVDLDRKARPRSIKVKFKWTPNTNPGIRIATIRLVPQNAEDQLMDKDGNAVDAVEIVVRQKSATRITDDRAGDSIAILTLNEKMRSIMEFNPSENMRNWNHVTLWEENDELPNDDPAAIGRVRSVEFLMIDIADGDELPREIKHLKYLESFGVQSNPNNQTRDVSLGEEICTLEHLKHLTVYAYGMCKLPENFKELGGSLETLNLAANNFANLSMLTEVINPENFPHLEALSFNGCRRSDTLKDLESAKADGYTFAAGNKNYPIGLHADIENEYKEKEALLTLLTWNKLEALSLSYNFLEGELPTDEEMLAVLQKPYYTEDDFFTQEELAATPSIYRTKLSNDTCKWLLTADKPVAFKQKDGSVLTYTGQQVPRVLPFTRVLSLNLNFFTGELPGWILFHPYFAEWLPETFLFTQEYKAKNSFGVAPGFSNIDEVNFKYDYYYGDKDYGNAADGVAYPLYYRRYVANTTLE